MENVNLTVDPETLQRNWADRVILIAEDVKINYLLIKSILSKTKVKILWATDGQKAIEAFKNHQDVDLILMDIQMPKLDGYEAAKQIREFKSEIPVIYQSANNVPQAVIDELQDPRSEYIAKPIHARKLITTISKYFDQ